MEEIILDIIIHHATHVGHNENTAAREISDIIKDFIKWKEIYAKLDIEKETYLVLIETHVLKEMKFNKLWNHWWNKVRNKEMK